MSTRTLSSIILCGILTAAGVGCASPGTEEGSGASENAIIRAETSCKTDGCVAAKNAEFKAVVEWVAASDECSSLVSWTQSIRATNDTDFQVVCGDTTYANSHSLRVKNPTRSADRAGISVEEIGVHDLAPITVETGCHTDGCALAKSTSFDAALDWIDSTDDCASTVSWPFSLATTGDGSYALTCGDSHDKVTINLEVADGKASPLLK